MSLDATTHRRISRWRIGACIVLVGQLVVLQGLNTSLEDESWFTGRLSATVEEGPLSLEGVAVNITIDMKENQDCLLYTSPSPRD